MCLLDRVVYCPKGFDDVQFIDKQLAKVNVIEPWYMRMRIIASTLVILALACTILFP